MPSEQQLLAELAALRAEVQASGIRWPPGKPARAGYYPLCLDVAYDRRRLAALEHPRKGAGKDRDLQGRKD